MTDLIGYGKRSLKEKSKIAYIDSAMNFLAVANSTILVYLASMVLVDLKNALKSLD
ncbi:hypothetical protein [Levilactobacillus brevis]|uniref:hypothetical protein n=1 Tax=Levilactobacillus brevis TaxID=1580 RepID=UPI0025A675A0|nr:hypothetical protein [Levilactobacillus brevis]